MASNTDPNQKKPTSQLAQSLLGNSSNRLSSSTKTKPESGPDERVLPVIPVREGVLFPSTESVLTFGRKSSVEAVKQAKFTNNMVILVTQKTADINDPDEKDVYEVGTLTVVERTMRSDGQVNALVRGVGRVKIKYFIKKTPYITARVEDLTQRYSNDQQTQALAKHLQKEFRQAVHLGKPVEFLNFMKLMSGVNDSELVDQIASTLNLDTVQKQELLSELDVKVRLHKVTKYLTQEIKVMEIEKDVAHKTQATFDKHMRENVLRERLRTIKKELGEIDDGEEVADEYRIKLKKLQKKGFPADLAKKIDKELKRLGQMSPNNPESGYVRSWLDTVFELPWLEFSKGNVDLKKAQKILDLHHHGLEDVKDRIMEYMAVLRLKEQQVKRDTKKHQEQANRLPTILCFVGPPGVGKTSIGRSIAEALGRKFVKVSLGGVRDEAEIRGHRRTYVGAMPGRIISGMKQAGSMNPVFMLDEIDKVGATYRGDPSSALLEALDPEQNKSFEDHYLDMPFDLSHVIFITTANTLDTIPSALRDRLEVIRYAGYTQDEKFHIAKDHLLEKVLDANGLKKTQLKLSDQILTTVIQRYTREAGVRNLERVLSKLSRKVARTLAEATSKTKAVTITNSKLQDYLGPEEYDITLKEKQDKVGLATGLAWTSVGGDVLFIEVALYEGKGEIKLTGQLGDVMKESAQAAMTYVKAHAKELGIPVKKLQTTDVHVHIPEGAVPKDGPSAGITLTTAIVSAFTNRPIRHDIAMTGEVTLRGRVLRIGGLKEKSIAGHRAGVSTIIIPEDNERDLVKIPESVKNDIAFKPVSTVDQVLALALAPKVAK